MSVHQHVLIMADIEGSSGCWSYDGSRFGTAEWARACLAMSLDVDAVVRALFEAGVPRVTVKDFHRTGYNLLPERIDRRADIVHGYRRGPVPGIGDPAGADAVMFIGLHAASGTTGFLAHTLTSRLARLDVNGRPLTEAQLFSASLAPFGLRPLFLSGCPLACLQAEAALPGIRTFHIDKSRGPESLDADAWRRELGRAAADAVMEKGAEPWRPQGPFRAEVVMRDGERAAQKIAGRWNLEQAGDTIILEDDDIHALYDRLIRLAYLTPFIEKVLPGALFGFNTWGRLGLMWVRRRLASENR